MLHTVYLSEHIKSRLTDVVLLQMCLLRYALFTININEKTCANYLNRYVRFRDRGGEIAEWLFSTAKRHEPLECFAASLNENEVMDQQEIHEKRQWCRQLYQQTRLLFNPSDEQSLPLPLLYEEKKAQEWQKEAAEYLVSFYDYLEGKTRFPEYLFSEQGAEDFGRQEFLYSFMEANSNLYVCAVCDESSYYTVIDENIRTDIDHYLPKSLYPHFSCHPYNLIPTCKICNQTVKGTKDPLEMNGKRLVLRDIYLPYHCQGLNTSTHLNIQLESADDPISWVKFGTLFAQDPSDQRMAQLIDTLAEVYKIPHRWEGRADTISETLFRRMRQFLGDGRGSPLGFDMTLTVYNTLNQLLYYLHQEDQSKDPFAFAMIWILVALMNEEYSLLKKELTESEEAVQKEVAKFPLIAELVEGLGQNVSNNEHRMSIAKQLLSRVQREVE